MFVRHIEGIASPLRAARALSRQRGFVWLDSAVGGSFSILAISPSRTAVFRDLADAGRFADFARSLVPHRAPQTGLPFAGGWIGFLAYEAYAYSPLVPFQPSALPPHPLAVFRRYDDFLLFDHARNEMRFIGFSSAAEKVFLRVQCLLAEADSAQNEFLTPATPLHMTVSQARYAADLKAVTAALERGDYFELNYTVGFACDYSSDPFALYLRLRQKAPAAMMSYLDLDTFRILSASPELFFKSNGRLIETEPIKGTIRRGENPAADALNRQTLMSSPKDRAELLMVTDMLRSDLGRVCVPGSVVVPVLQELRSFAHYHHLVSRISGLLREDCDFFALFCALFPGGSITGAPKIAVMRHIDRLEKRPRGVYTGAIGYISDDGQMQFNIPIRTAVVADGGLTFATGGGIVADSSWQAEYDECLIKAQGLLSALQP